MDINIPQISIVLYNQPRNLQGVTPIVRYFTIVSLYFLIIVEGSSSFHYIFDYVITEIVRNALPYQGVQPVEKGHLSIVLLSSYHPTYRKMISSTFLYARNFFAYATRFARFFCSSLTYAFNALLNTSLSS